MWRADSSEKTLMLERLKVGGEGDDRGWDGWMASPTPWTQVWVDSGSWWWTGRPGVLRSMGSQRVGHDWATEQLMSYGHSFSMWVWRPWGKNWFLWARKVLDVLMRCASSDNLRRQKEVWCIFGIKFSWGRVVRKISEKALLRGSNFRKLEKHWQYD